MHKLYLTDFVEVVSKSGISKANKVKEILNRPEYHPSMDFYRKLRECIIRYHDDGLTKRCFEDMYSELTDTKKRTKYRTLIDQYISWLGRKKIKTFEHISLPYIHSDITITVNPELGLIINDIPYLIKLYFKAEPLSKNKTEIITHLMAEAYHDSRLPKHTKMAVLDIHKKKLLCPTVPISGLTISLNAELAYISVLIAGFEHP
jgi:hypothetical protein